MILMKTRANSLRDVKQLNMWGFNLRDVSICSQMPNIEVMALSVNNISSLAPFQNCKKLKELHLRRNAISDFNQLQYLQNLPSLRTLALSENPIAGDVDYRAKVLKILPQLEILDSVAVADYERSHIPVRKPPVHEPRSVPHVERKEIVGEDEHQKALLSAVLALLPELSMSSISVVLSSIMELPR